MNEKMQNGPTRVLHLLRTSRFSGAENVACQIINICSGQDHEMVYASPDGDIAASLSERGITFLPMRKFSLFETRRVIKQYQPDVIHAHDVSASVAAALTGGGARLVAHVHANFINMRRPNLKTIAFLLASMRIGSIFWVAQSASNNYAFAGVVRRKSSTLYNVIERSEILKRLTADTTSYDVDAIFVGRLDYQKDPERLIRVFSLVVAQEPQIRLAIVGSGDLLAVTSELVKQLGLTNNIAFYGYVSNPLKMMYDAKVMMLVSRFEGTPMCALEALALGLPIVSTPTDGLKEMLSGELGELISDSDEELAQQIIKIVTDSSERARFSKASLAQHMALNNIDTYRSAILRAYARGTSRGA